VQHKGEPLGRAERIQHDLERDPDRIGQQRFVFRIGPDRRVVADRLRQEAVERLLAACPAEPEHVQADPGDHCRQPPLEAVDLRGVVRRSRNQASCTASSHSLTEPRIRYATERSRGRCRSNLSASSTSFIAVTASGSRGSHRIDPEPQPR
jgi:hypothetical protein